MSGLEVVIPYVVQAVVAYAVGAIITSLLSEDAQVEGPRLGDKNVTSSTYGNAIPIVRGTARIAGNVIWSAGIREVSNTKDVGGGKGKNDGTEVTTYSYFATFAVSLCANEISAVSRVWANGTLIHDARPTAETETYYVLLYNPTSGDAFQGYTDRTGIHFQPGYVAAASPMYTAMSRLKYAINMTLYPGTETQLQDPTMQAALGTVPAYRGQAYVVIHDLPLEKFGNRIPNLQFEVVESGVRGNEVTVYTPVAGLRSMLVYNPLLNEIWQTMAQTVMTDPYIARINADTGELVGYVYPVDTAMEYRYVPGTINSVGDPVFDFVTLQVYFINSAGLFVAIDAGSGVEAGSVTLATAFNPGLSQPTVDLVTGDIWFANLGTQDFSLISATTGAEIRTVEMNLYFIDMVSDDVAGDLWIVAWHPVALDVQKSLRRIDASGISVVYTHTVDLGLLAYDVMRNLLHIQAGGANTIIVFDIASFAVIGTYDVMITPTDMTYDPLRDMIWVANWAAGSGTLAGYHADTGVLYNSVTDADQGLTIVPGKNAIYMSGGATTNLTDWDTVKVRFDRVTSDTVPLSDIVQDICVRAGMASAQVDVSELVDGVYGYVLSRQDAARSYIQQLAVGFLFEGVESDEKIKFHKLGAAPAITIDADDLAAHDSSGSLPDLVTTARGMDVELPQKLNIVFSSVLLDYQPGTQQAERLSGVTPESGQINTIELPIVMTEDYARQLADALMFNAWTARTRYQFQTGVKFAEYEPTDVVVVDSRVLRITRKQEAGGVIKWEGTAEDASIYTQTMTGVSIDRAEQTIPSIGVAFFIPLDTALLRDQDDAPGFYAAVSGYTSDFDGAVLFKSNDGGTTFTSLEAFTDPSTVGVALNSLGDFHGGNNYDDVNYLTVRLYGDATLASVSNLAMLNGSNAAAVESTAGWEIIQFRDATLNVGGTYTLTGLLRARKGTDYAMGAHAAGNRFVLLNSQTIGDLDASTAEIGLEREYKAVAVGDSLINAHETGFTLEGVRLKPLSPVHLGGGRNNLGDARLNWVRRTRTGGEWRDTVDVPVGEDSELYDVDVYTDATYTVVARTFSDQAVQHVDYTAAQQTTDFGGAQATVYWKVYELSTLVGRGFAGTGST